MKIGNLNIDGNLFSAPLAGVSDSVFRWFCRRNGASATVSEMVSAKGLSYLNKKTLGYINFGEEERPIGIQLFSADPQSALEGLKVVLRVKPDFIDFNFGCPAKKVLKQGAGGALLKKPDLIVAILKTMIKNSPIPITAKLRSGWDSSSIIFPDLANRLQDIGLSAIFVHPRTVVQEFSQKPDRELVARTVSDLEIPVIYSGDITSAEDAKRALEETGADGIMIGRAAMGDPHIFTRIRHYLDKNELIPEPSPPEKIDMLIEYYEKKIDYYGLRAGMGMKTMRKFFVYYTRGLPGNSQIRQEIFHLDGEQEVLDKLKSYRDRLSAENIMKTV